MKEQCVAFSLANQVYIIVFQMVLYPRFVIIVAAMAAFVLLASSKSPSTWPYAGVESVDIDLKEQKVVVKGNVQPEDIFQTVSKTGKKTEFWQ